VAFADYVWKPYVPIEMKKRGEDLKRQSNYGEAVGCILMHLPVDQWPPLVPPRREPPPKVGRFSMHPTRLAGKPPVAPGVPGRSQSRQ
jgi:hypothetical protein